MEHSLTTEQRRLIDTLVRTPTRAPIAPDEFLRRFPAEDGQELARRLALSARTEDDLQAALTVAHTFEAIDATWTPILAGLIRADFHTEHEYLTDLLAELRDPRAVDALAHAATWVPDYLDWDDNRNLASKAIWGLRKNPSPDAVPALITLTGSDDPVVAEAARDRLLDRLQDAWLDQLRPTFPQPDQHRTISVLTPQGPTEASLAIHDEPHSCTLTLTTPDGRQHEANSISPWYALESLRETTDPEGITLLINGYRGDVYPSTASHHTAYRLALGQPWRQDDLVDLFDPAPADTCATPTAQKTHHEHWLASLLPWPTKPTLTVQAQRIGSSGEPTETWGLDVMEGTQEVSVTATAPDGPSWSASAAALWEALVDLRGQLERVGVLLGINAARPDVQPSRMSLQMGGGRLAYRVRLGQQAGRDALVDVLDPAPLAEVGSVAAQNAFRQEWFASLR